jgi:hypothetical protein
MSVLLLDISPLYCFSPSGGFVAAIPAFDCIVLFIFAGIRIEPSLRRFPLGTLIRKA